MSSRRPSTSPTGSGSGPDAPQAVAAWLRIALLVPLIVMGIALPDSDWDHVNFFVILAIFGVWGVISLRWALVHTQPRWSGIACVGIDLALFSALALTSAGQTSYITPVFYIYSVFTVFYYRPMITAAVGLLVALAYAVVWLENLAVRGGPEVDGVVWLHFLLLLWTSALATTLAFVLARRARREAERSALNESLTAQLLASDQRAAMQLADVLHDGPLQDIIAARRLLDSADGRLHPDRVAAVRGILEATTSALRGTVTELHPHVLTELGLAAAIQELADQTTRRSEVAVAVSISSLPPVSDAQSFTLYAAARELLSNVRRHARATTVEVTLTGDDHRILLAVIDDGIGIDDRPGDGRHVRTGHIGLASQELRLRSAGGRLRLSRVEPHGTCARVELPRDPAAASADDLARPLHSPAMR